MADINGVLSSVVQMYLVVSTQLCSLSEFANYDIPLLENTEGVQNSEQS